MFAAAAAPFARGRSVFITVRKAKHLFHLSSGPHHCVDVQERHRVHEARQIRLRLALQPIPRRQEEGNGLGLDFTLGVVASRTVWNSELAIRPEMTEKKMPQFVPLW
jgi:hypothetical protein